MKTALFTNFTNETFIGYWDGKAKKFEPGKSVYMPDYLARHFAKHLTNRELLRTDKDGNLLIKGGDKMTSPKFPEQAPLFMDLFNKAYTPDEDEAEFMEKEDAVDTQIAMANKNRAGRDGSKATTSTPPPGSPGSMAGGPMVIEPPSDDEDDSEASFGGTPAEPAPQG